MSTHIPGTMIPSDGSISVPSVRTSSTSKTKLNVYTERDLCMENFDLIAKVKELLKDHQLWGPDGTYTFRDGERWARIEETEDE